MQVPHDPLQTGRRHSVALCRLLPSLPRRAPRKGMGAPSKGARTVTAHTPGGAMSRIPLSTSFPPSLRLCGHPRHYEAISAIVQPSPALWRPVLTRHHHADACATRALPHRKTLEQAWAHPRFAYRRRPSTDAGQGTPQSRSSTSTGVVTPSAEAGIHRQSTTSAKICKDNYHTRHTVRQYATTVDIIMQHDCSCLPLAYKRRRQTPTAGHNANTRTCLLRSITPNFRYWHLPQSY
jgi:hypothetical protein